MQLMIPDSRVREAQEWICRSIRDAGGRALLVGGCVRDMALGLPANDIDIEVFGIAPDRLQQILLERYRVEIVGKAFGVLKLHHLPIDVAVARKESKVGFGHKGFNVRSDPDLSLEEAAARRDFTVNAISYDSLEDELIDPCGGMADLEQKILRHVSDQFCEDPLRVLRAMQFTARFGFSVAAETIELCRTIEFEGLPMERVYEEWKKLICVSAKPSLGLQFLRACGWIRYFPELEALIDTPQEAEWHPEGDVWTHTGHVMDAFASERLNDEWEDLVVGLAAMCHDLGKPATTHFEDGRIRSRRHDMVGEGPTRTFLDRLTRQRDLVEDVVVLVLAHHRPRDLYEQGAGDTAIRRLAGKVGRLDRLVRVARADTQGRPPKVFDGFPAGDWLLERARALEVETSAPRPIVLGRHLIELGLDPGPHFAPLLDACFEAQLEGKITTVEQGIAMARAMIAKKGST